MEWGAIIISKFFDTSTCASAVRVYYLSIERHELSQAQQTRDKTMTNPTKNQVDLIMITAIEAAAAKAGISIELFGQCLTNPKTSKKATAFLTKFLEVGVQVTKKAQA